MPNVPYDGGVEMTLHVCPTCGKTHAVNPARHSVSWGRQLSCSCACEAERRRRIRKQLLGAPLMRAADGH
jgi:hypothetical protein